MTKRRTKKKENRTNIYIGNVGNAG